MDHSKIVLLLFSFTCIHNTYKVKTKYANIRIIESTDSISRDEQGFPLTQYITNGGISCAGHTITHFEHHHRVLRLISSRMSV